MKVYYSLSLHQPRGDDIPWIMSKSEGTTFVQELGQQKNLKNLGLEEKHNKEKMKMKNKEFLLLPPHTKRRRKKRKQLKENEES